MADFDKTVMLEPGDTPASYGVCPICSQKLQPDWDNVELLRCPACGYSKKVVTSMEPGSIVAHKYRILSYLNSGGGGMIYLCNPVSDASVRYVLKVLKHPTATSRKRFRREADILSSLNKNIRIARIVDFWEVNEDSYIVMEYINGQNLKSLYNSCDFDEYSILLIAHEITRALQDIWNEFNIIHRDIKPENIMVDENSHIKLLDFGLSKQCCEEMDSSTNMITLPRASLGTPGYMSPEHFTNFKDMDFRSDIYSLGATLYFLLTGFEANSGETMVDYYNNTLACSPPPLESFQGRCSSGCANLIRRMMQAKAADRYDSYAELVSEIKVLLKKAAG